MMTYQLTITGLGDKASIVQTVSVSTTQDGSSVPGGPSTAAIPHASRVQFNTVIMVTVVGLLQLRGLDPELSDQSQFRTLTAEGVEEVDARLSKA
jgi:hypothetical protein